MSIDICFKMMYNNPVTKDVQRKGEHMFQITLKAARVNQGLSRKTAAKLLEIHPSTLANWEKGRTYPTIEQYHRLCQVYGCPVDAIFLPL